jgi:hypothetical protein
MKTVFISGSISIGSLDREVAARIANAVEGGLSIIVGDANGVDSLAQQTLIALDAQNVVVYCSGTHPRNNLGHWPVETVQTDAKPGTRAYFTAKDLTMAMAADYGLMIWDRKSQGTLKNVAEMLARNRTSVVYLADKRRFMTIATPKDFAALLDCMTKPERAKAEAKLKIIPAILGQAAGQGAFAV